MTTKPLVFGDVKPSKGPWRKEGSGMHASVKDGDGFIVAVRHRLPGNEHEANVDLIADAGTTYNETGLTPSQLAARVAELEADMQSIIDCCEEDHASRNYASRLTEIRSIAINAKRKAEGG